MSNPTAVGPFMEELNAGVFEEKLAATLSEVVGAVIDHDKKGKIVITLDLDRIGETYQVKVDHTLKFTKPTARGSITQDDKTSTPMHVGKGGAMSLFPEDQLQMFTKSGKPETTQ